LSSRISTKVIASAFRSGGSAEWQEAAEQLVNLVSTSDPSSADLAEFAASIADSGERLRLPLNASYCDVPSTGGPGSLSTLLSPLLLASCGVRVPKISAAGSVAGGIDTLAILSGFRSKLSSREFVRLVTDVGIAHITQTSAFCPADAVLISVRKRHDLMANPALAAVSLLAKKMAVKGCSALFDFRAGPTGNVGDTLDEAIQAAELFQDVADVLGVRMGAAVTDNRTFPSTSLGRLESLDLMTSLLRQDRATVQTDLAHLETCVALAAAALEVSMDMSAAKAEAAVKATLESGAAYRLFLKHLSAQGVSEASLDRAIEVRSLQRVELFLAPSTGYWTPPTLPAAKKWIKKQQQKSLNPSDQVGYRLRVLPGQWVESGEVVAEVRAPKLAKAVTTPAWLGGTVEAAPAPKNEGVIAVRLGRSAWRNGGNN
jgi:thymidine phosphorylase